MKCEVCNAEVSELRRGRCWGCYNRWVEARPVGLGAHCCVCGERRRTQLRGVELLGSWMPMCYGCSGRSMRLTPMPQTLDGIRGALQRDRREDDRRGRKKDTRVFQYDRRNGDRREGRPDVDEGWFLIDDDMIVDEAELEGGRSSGQRAVEEALTCIRDAPLFGR